MVKKERPTKPKDPTLEQMCQDKFKDEVLARKAVAEIDRLGNRQKVEMGLLNIPDAYSVSLYPDPQDAGKHDEESE